MPAITVNWTWEEAFDKFGFGDGDGLNMTDDVASAIAGRFPNLDVTTETWGIHNYIIFAITEKRNKKSVYKPCPDEGAEWSIGYDEPRKYLPDNIVRFLDRTFPDKPAKKARKKHA
jgi:hypothetical protein